MNRYSQLTFTRVAWVPWSWDADEARGAYQLSMDWALEQAAATGATPVLRLHSHAHDWTHRTSSHARYAQVAIVVTERGRGARGPTPVPGAPSMGLVAGGMRCANGFALVVEDHPALPLAGWAAELGAVNLRTGEPTEEHRNPELVERVRALASSLYNGWSSLPGSAAAKHRGPELAAAGLTWADFVGTLLVIAPQHVDEKRHAEVGTSAVEDRNRDPPSPATRTRPFDTAR